MKKIVLSFLIFSSSIFAQNPWNVSVSNLLRYGTGNMFEHGLKQKKEYFENLTDSRISYNNFTLGFRLLHDSPPEYGEEFTGIKKRYIEFRKDNIYIRAGDSYTLFGRGMAINLFEDRNLVYDTGIDGLKIEYNTKLLRLVAFGGNMTHKDQIITGNEEYYKLRAGSIEISPLNFFSIGSNFVSGKITFNTIEPESEFNIPEFFGQINIADFDIFTSYTLKRTDPKSNFFYPNPERHEGKAFYGSISYTTAGLGISAEYKDYRFGIVDPNYRLTQRIQKAFAFQNPPIVHKEHAFTLLSRYPHVIDFNDEVGYQLDIFYTFIENFTGSINFAAASRHFSFSPTGDTNIVTQAPIYLHDSRKNSYLPIFNSKYSPFWEIYTDIQYYFGKFGTDYIQIGTNRRYEDKALESIIVNNDLYPLIESTRSTAIVAAAQYTFDKTWGLRFIAERQWVYDGANTVDPNLTNQLFSISVFKSPNYSISIRYEFTDDNGTIDGRKDWTLIDFGYKLSQNHNITFSIGSDRGGKGCDNGVCKSVPPFNGFRASIVSYL